MTMNEPTHEEILLRRWRIAVEAKAVPAEGLHENMVDLRTNEVVHCRNGVLYREPMNHRLT
jgi:hypothetical protein